MTAGHAATVSLDGTDLDVSSTTRVWDNGFLDLPHSASLDAATLTVGGSMTVDDSTLSVTGTLDLASTGTLTIDNGSSVTADSFTADGTLNWNSGNIQVADGSGFTLANDLTIRAKKHPDRDEWLDSQRRR